jgi:hypothetical protein
MPMLQSSRVKLAPAAMHVPSSFLSVPPPAVVSSSLPSSSSSVIQSVCTCSHDDFASPDACAAYCGHLPFTCGHSHLSFADPELCSEFCTHSHASFPCPAATSAAQIQTYQSNGLSLNSSQEVLWFDVVLSPALQFIFRTLDFKGDPQYLPYVLGMMMLDDDTMSDERHLPCPPGPAFPGKWENESGGKVWYTPSGSTQRSLMGTVGLAAVTCAVLYS